MDNNALAIKFFYYTLNVDDFTYDFLLQLCHGVEGKRVKSKEKKIDYQDCEKCNVERIMYPHLGFYVCRSCGVCGNDICYWIQ